MKRLKKKDKLRFNKPEIKQTFILPVNPGEITPDMLKDMEIQYTGYSSIHYVVQPSKTVDPSPDIASLYAEIQVRTIFEEAWGEIHHKYQYEPIRSKIKLPDYINRGFYTLSAYLQSAALQAEYLCAEVKTILLSKNEELIAKKLKQKGVKKIPRPSTIKRAIEKTFGFALSDEAFSHIQDQLRRFSVLTMKDIRNKILKGKLINDFKEIYRQKRDREPFQRPVERDTDAINAINFALSCIRNPIEYAKKRLREVLEERTIIE